MPTTRRENKSKASTATATSQSLAQNILRQTSASARKRTSVRVGAGAFGASNQPTSVGAGAFGASNQPTSVHSTLAQFQQKLQQQQIYRRRSDVPQQVRLRTADARLPARIKRHKSAGDVVLASPDNSQIRRKACVFASTDSNREGLDNMISVYMCVCVCVYGIFAFWACICLLPAKLAPLIPNR